MHLVNIKRYSIISTIFLLYQELGSAFLGSKKGFSTMIASLRSPFISTDNFSPILEIAQLSEGALGMFDMIKEASINWDGKKPIMDLGEISI